MFPAIKKVMFESEELWELPKAICRNCGSFVSPVVLDASDIENSPMAFVCVKEGCSEADQMRNIEQVDMLVRI